MTMYNDPLPMPRRRRAANDAETTRRNRMVLDQLTRARGVLIGRADSVLLGMSREQFAGIGFGALLAVGAMAAMDMVEGQPREEPATDAPGDGQV
jgi:hypothetical protein